MALVVGGAVCAACSSKQEVPAAPAALPADAAVDGGRARIVLAQDGTLSFLDASGHPLLRTVATARVAAGVPYVALGFSTSPEPELVPPSFDALPETPAPPESARHAVTGVASTTTTSDGFVALLTTDDPAGRTMTLTASEANGLERVDVTTSEPASGSDGVTAVFASFESPPGESFHGFGGRREGTDLRGRTIANWVFDYRFPNVGTAYYYPQPLFLSSQGYALFTDTDRMATFRMASDVPDAFRVSVADSALHLALAPEGGTAGLAMITAVTGREPVPPSWSLGPTLSRTVQLYVDTPSVYQRKVTDDVSRITTGSYLVEAYAYEGWAQLPMDFVTTTNATLVAAGIHPMLYIRSFVANDAAGTEPKGRFDEAVQRAFVATHADGTPYTFPDSFPGAKAAVIDFTNPAAVSWWKGLVTQMLDTGADGFMCDFGEQVLPDMVFADGTTGATTHNRFPVLQHRATREALDAYSSAHPDRRLFFFSRSGYAGSPGSAAYEGTTFPGDESTDYAPSTGLPSIVPDMLNRSIFGAYGFTTDIGGYADFVGTGPTEELYVRWMEAAVFTTHFRVHNSALSGVRMPWSFGAETEATWKEMAALHVRARPLVEQLWQRAQRTGEPPIRPLFLGDASPDARAHADDEWLVGPDLLVAPVLTQGATSREVWFPAGSWQIHGDGATYDGPGAMTIDAPLRELPWFTRQGAAPLDMP